MTALQFALFLLVGIGGTVTVLTRNLPRQTLIFSLYGMLMSLLFVAIASVDVAFSELAVGAAALPLMLLVSIGSVAQSRKKKK
ncbi:MAG TPA: hydrogenase subunit MbhD domain-containing protein [Chthoniobacterales bacterium]|nr:hydrogenase subunit MbhD domain-containing protein [Chthoniobacterales bacterium]